MIGFLVDVLATFRLQRLVGVDGITDDARARLYTTVEKRLGTRQANWLDEMLDCPWCRTVWAALAVLTLRRIPGGRWLVRLLAVSGAAALIVVHFDQEGIHDPDGVAR